MLQPAVDITPAELDGSLALSGVSLSLKPGIIESPEGHDGNKYG
jgi:hypothetical protein